MNSKRVFLVSLFMACGIFSGAALAQPAVKNDVQAVKSDVQDAAPSDAELSATEPAQLEDSEGENETEAPRIFIPPAENDLLSLNFREIDVRGLISALAMQREINVVMSQDVSGKVSVHLYKVTLEEALVAITMAGGFAYQKYGGLYYIYKPAKVKDPRQDKLKMWVYKLKYIKVEKVQEILQAFPEMGLIKIHEPSRTIIVQDLPENIEKLESLISHLDAAPKQVLIEAKILEITLTDDMLLGVDWTKLLGKVSLGTQGFSRAIIPTVATEKISAVPVTTTSTGVFANVITATGTRQQFAAAVDALQTITKINTLSTPKILAIHGEEARVQVGKDLGYLVTTVNQGISTVTTEFIKTGTMLEITPYINEEGFILLKVHPNVSTGDIPVGGQPVVVTTDVTTWLLAKDGETAFIGGLIRDTKTRTKNMIPCLGSIPTLGVLFGKTQNTINKTELVILITTQIVDTEEKQENRETRDRIRDMEEKIKKDVEQPHKDFFK